jgi:hypothetical protein
MEVKCDLPRFVFMGRWQVRYRYGELALELRLPVTSWEFPPL